MYLIRILQIRSGSAAITYNGRSKLQVTIARRGLRQNQNGQRLAVSNVQI